ncbi:hypothetical protein [Rhodococcus sp. ACPA1]|uniref:hypothetical protein n=1 Tax=Rhodococcus sp. ACPA1 TaxID=2028572 RepID=UPI000BB0D290|nr:hypothetical protein [Rhodococcus sp. ACPA1]PBC45339.1 hypothetical protein CJ177_46355 [Rhodococcus sp. ACPA1]
MGEHLTSTDLDDWSRRRDSEAHLPTLVRRLIMATVRPDRIRIPAAESVALPGLDGTVKVPGGAKPFVPAGDSVWEFGTDYARKRKATEDYEKRTEEMSAAERASTTFVFVTSRRWGAGDKWATEMKAGRDGWKDIVALTADDLATWLEMCPGVAAWLTEHLGKGSLGDTGLPAWFGRWSEQTVPTFPAGVLVAGRRPDVVRVLDALDENPGAIEVAAGSVDEAIAFVAAALTLGPGPAPRVEQQQSKGVEEDDGDDATASVIEDTPQREPEELEALRERAIVIEDTDGWRRWSTHPSPHILIPTFVPDSIDAALDAGHHVVLPRVARTAQDPGRLAPLDPHSAGTAWQETGFDFYRAQDLARACRRNLGSVRRRLGRYEQEHPAWAREQSAALLASALLAGGWDADEYGDREIVTALTGHPSWRALSRELVAYTTGEDAPLGVLDDQWDFTDVVDAWDALGSFVTTEDLKVFAEHVQKVLAEVHPDANLSGDQRRARMLDPTRPRRRYSNRLRRGLATTLAILGAVAGDEPAAGGQSGQSVATTAVRGLLHGADADRWMALTDVLGLLAEAAPDAFLTALEDSLGADDPPVMALFSERESGLGDTRSSHSALLWALETLAFSRAHVSRVAVVLARLADRDPGGRLSNRPDESLKALLHLTTPQGAVTSANRLAVLDAVLNAVPEQGTELMVSLIRVGGVGVIRSGPRYRDWPTPRTRSNRAESVEEVCARLLASESTDWAKAAGLVGRVSPANRASIVRALGDKWDEFDPTVREEILTTVAEVADRHRQLPDAAWSLPPEELSGLDTFLTNHGAPVNEASPTALFEWAADIATETDDEQDELTRRRREAVLELTTEGIAAVAEFAKTAERPELVGQVLAQVTDELDERVLDLLSTEADHPILTFASNFANLRSRSSSWLTEQVTARPNQAALLLLSADLNNAVLDLVDDAQEGQRELFWTQLSPYRANNETIERVCTGLLDADRPFSAITAANARHTPGISTELMLRVLTAPITGTAAEAAHHLSIDYQVGGLLDRLEAAGVPDNKLGQLEFFYLPILDHQRTPRALHRELAREPETFADVVSRVYRPDESDPGDDDAAAKAMDEPTTAALEGEEYRFSDACFRLLHGWDQPLPGGTVETPPSAATLQAWVNKSREALHTRNRARIASRIIGETLGVHTTTDGDGTWPCLAVREVLEHEQDPDLENALALARVNQRGDTIRGIYTGGNQERELAAQHRAWAESVRDRWPRTGAILERLAQHYTTDGRREDRDAERDARE